MENKDILEQLKEGMDSAELEFNSINQQIAQINTKLEELIQRREQVRGQYTAYYNLVQSLQGNNKTSVEPDKKDNVEIEDKKDRITKNTTSKTPKKNDKKEEEIKVDKKEEVDTVVNQTEDILKALQGTTNEQTETKQFDTKGNEIPEYLIDEYNK